MDGELVQLRGKKQPKRMALQERGKQAIYSELLWLEAQRGKKKGWAGCNYRDIFGVYPRGLKDTQEPPHGDLMEWIRHKQIAWAKSRRAA
jgi:hypothetical protein